MELVFWYVVIGLLVCGIATAIQHVRLEGHPTEFKPSGILISITVWPIIIIAVLLKLILWVFKR